MSFILRYCTFVFPRSNAIIEHLELFIVRLYDIYINISLRMRLCFHFRFQFLAHYIFEPFFFLSFLTLFFFLVFFLMLIKKST